MKPVRHYPSTPGDGFAIIPRAQNKCPRKPDESARPNANQSSVAALHEDAPPYRVNGNSSGHGRTAPPPIARLLAKKKLIPFGWYGGKFSHLDWLLPLLPACHHYCEPFAGSGAVLLNRDPSPVETFNDLDGEVVNFFRVLREEKERLIEAIGSDPVRARGICAGLRNQSRLVGAGTRPAVLCPRPAGADGARTDGHGWPLGELQKHQSRRHERRHQPVAGRGGGFAGGGRAVASRANRKSSGSGHHLTFTIHRARCFTATRLTSIPRAATRRLTNSK